MADKEFSTPVGTAVYPRLKTPDTKFDELGIYKADIAIPMAEAQELMDQLSAIHKDHTGKVPKKSENTMWLFETDESGEETGNVVFKIRVKNRLNKKTGELWDRRPKLFDASLKPVDVNVWGGSKYAVSGTIYEWSAGDKKGVSLQPMGVQIIELVEGGSDGLSGSSMGFKARDGFVAPEPEDQEESDEMDDVNENDDDTSSSDEADY